MDVGTAMILVLFLLFAVGGTVAAVKTVRAVSRGVERTALQARRMVEDTSIKARRYTQPGAAGELARLRHELRTSIDSTRRALETGAVDDPSLGEAAALLKRLDGHARALDGELKLLEREPDKARVTDRLPELGERAGRITHSADSLRWAAQDRARQFGTDDLAALGHQIELEAGALRHWAPAELPGDQPGKLV